MRSVQLVTSVAIILWVQAICPSVVLADSNAITYQNYIVEAKACDTRYTDCLNRADPYCKDETANVAIVSRAAAYVLCLGQYQDTFSRCTKS